MELIINIVGWLGAFLILLGYFLVSSNKVTGTSNTYQLINLLGSIGILVNAYYFKALPSVGLNVVWMLIALKTLFFAKKQNTNQ